MGECHETALHSAKTMKKLKIGLCSSLVLLMLSGCSQEEATAPVQMPSTTVDNSQTTSNDAVSSDTTDDSLETDDVVASEVTSSELPPLGQKPTETNDVESPFFGEVYDLYQGQSEKIDIEEFKVSEDGTEVEGGAITETVEDYLALVMLADDKTTTFYVTEETQFNEDIHSKEAWLSLLLEAHDAGFTMFESQFDLEITYSEDKYGNYYIDYADISTVDKYTESDSVDISSLEYSDSATAKIRYIFAVGDDLMTITTFQGDRGDDSMDIEYRISDNTSYSSLDSAILDAQVKDAILSHGSSLSEDMEMLCNLYWNADDTHNDYQNLAHIELVSFG